MINPDVGNKQTTPTPHTAKPLFSSDRFSRYCVNDIRRFPAVVVWNFRHPPPRTEKIPPPPIFLMWVFCVYLRINVLGRQISRVELTPHLVKLTFYSNRVVSRRSDLRFGRCMSLDGAEIPYTNLIVFADRLPILRTS